MFSPFCIPFKSQYIKTEIGIKTETTKIIPQNTRHGNCILPRLICENVAFMKMVKPFVIGIAAIPVILAILIVIPMVTMEEIPTSAINPNDNVYIEFTKHDLRLVSFGVTEKSVADITQVLIIENDGSVQYTEVKDGVNQSLVKSSISDEQIQKLTAMIKETGFMSIPKDSFPIKDDVESYTKFMVKITLNDAKTQIFWSDQDSTEKFIPPIITAVEEELVDIISKIIE